MSLIITPLKTKLTVDDLKSMKPETIFATVAESSCS